VNISKKCGVNKQRRFTVSASFISRDDRESPGECRVLDARCVDIGRDKYPNQYYEVANELKIMSCSLVVEFALYQFDEFLDAQ
jgi:hypothetical protein